MSIDVCIVGSRTQELEGLVRASGMRASSTPSVDLLRFAQFRAQRPGVVVLDLRERIDLPSALALIKKDLPATGIVVVAATLEPALMLEAMRAGVTEYVTEPVTRADLVAAIGRVSGDPGAQSTGEVFAVGGVKGGVGATTVAVNIATALAQKTPGSVLLIDLHPACGDAALFLGAEPRFSMLDALENASRLDDTYLRGLVTKTKAGVDLMASPDRVVAVAADPPQIRAVVDAASRCYRYLVLDAPLWEPSIASALELSSSITIVATQDVAALRNGNRLATFLRQRYGEHRIRVVANRFERSAELSETDVERALGGPVCGMFPSADRAGTDALNRGLPIVLESHSKLGDALSTYARSLVTGAELESNADDARGLLRVLSGRGRTSSRK